MSSCDNTPRTSLTSKHLKPDRQQLKLKPAIGGVASYASKGSPKHYEKSFLSSSPTGVLSDGKMKEMVVLQDLSPPPW